LRTILATYLAKTGEKESALWELQPVEQAHVKELFVLYNSAMVYELCGNRDRALELLLAAIRAGQSLADIKNEPEFVALWADPRYHLTILAASATPTKR